MAVNRERLGMGIAALRSGEFEQGQGHLRETVINDDRPDGFAYCCLGVLTEVALREGVPGVRRLENGHNGHWYEVFIEAEPCDAPNCGCEGTAERWIDGSNGILSPRIRDYYGLEDDDPKFPEAEPGFPAMSAVTLNDKLGWDFGRIAQAFEDTYMTGEGQ